MELLELRQTLQALLADELGTFSNGQKAIWVEPPAVPQTLKVTGLQCIIERWDQQIGLSSNLLNNQTSYTSTWQVILTLYDRSPSELAKLDSAIDKIRRRFPRHQRRPIPIIDDVYPQVTFVLQFFHIKNTILP